MFGAISSVPVDTEENESIAKFMVSNHDYFDDTGFTFQ